MNRIAASIKSYLPISAWCLYDFACASFSVIVMTFIFATYFTTKVAENNIIGTYQWANATSMAGVIIAFSSPLFGAIADHGGYHKRWLGFFSLMCIVSSALLWFAYPTVTSVSLMLTCLVFGTIGLEIALVFYNALLPQLSTKENLGRISGLGWGCGYIGGIIALSVALIVFVKLNVFGLKTETAAQIRICGPFVACWYILFAIPLFLFVPSIPSTPRPMSVAIRSGCRELWRTIKRLSGEKNISLYLLSHMIYTDGLNTLFVFGGIYAAGTYGLSFEEVLLFGISMNITAGIGAILFGWMDDYVGSKATVITALICLIGLGIPLLLLHDKIAFWVVALAVCVFVGPVQSASRSLMVRLIGDQAFSTEMFGLYALSGRITSFIGPWMLGMVTLYFGSQRAGMATILVFFALGVLLLMPVKVVAKIGSAEIAE